MHKGSVSSMGGFSSNGKYGTIQFQLLKHNSKKLPASLQDAGRGDSSGLPLVKHSVCYFASHFSYFQLITIWNTSWYSRKNMPLEADRLSSNLHSSPLFALQTQVFNLFVSQFFISEGHPRWLSSVHSLSRVQLFVTTWTAACQASLSITNSQSLIKHMSIESMMSSNHLILSHPPFLPPSIFPSIRVFSNVNSSHQVAKVLELQL